MEVQNFKSLYHLETGELYGKETKPTFYLHRNIEKPYHIDYCVIKENMIEQGVKTTIGNFEDWIGFSDHAPLVVDIKE